MRRIANGGATNYPRSPRRRSARGTAVPRAPKDARKRLLFPPEPGEALVLAALRELERSVPAYDRTLYDHEAFHAALQDYLDLEIRVALLRDDVYALADRAMRISAIEAALVHVEGADHVTIMLPASAPEISWPELLYHELWHLAAGHPIPFHREGAERSTAFWRPPRTLCPRVPPFDLAACAHDTALLHRCVAWCEADAEAAIDHLYALSTFEQASRANDWAPRRLLRVRSDRRDRQLRAELRVFRRLSSKFSTLLDLGPRVPFRAHTIQAALRETADRLRLDPADELKARRAIAAVALLWSADITLYEEVRHLLGLRSALTMALPASSAARRSVGANPTYDALTAALWLLQPGSAPTFEGTEPWLSPVIAFARTWCEHQRRAGQS